LRRTNTAMVAAVVVLAIAACGDDDATTTTAPTPATTSATPASTTAAPASGQSVTVFDFSFAPMDLTVAVGTTVRWTNDDPFPHTTTADDGFNVTVTRSLM